MVSKHINTRKNGTTHHHQLKLRRRLHEEMRASSDQVNSHRRVYPPEEMNDQVNWWLNFIQKDSVNLFFKRKLKKKSMLQSIANAWTQLEQEIRIHLRVSSPKTSKFRLHDWRCTGSGKKNDSMNQMWTRSKLELLRDSMNRKKLTWMVSKHNHWKKWTRDLN